MKPGATSVRLARSSSWALTYINFAGQRSPLADGYNKGPYWRKFALSTRPSESALGRKLTSAFLDVVIQSDDEMKRPQLTLRP